jgi:hypothetical protein
VDGECTAVDASWPCGMRRLEKGVPGLGREAAYEENPGSSRVAGFRVGRAIEVARMEAV